MTMGLLDMPRAASVMIGLFYSIDKFLVTDTDGRGRVSAYILGSFHVGVNGDTEGYRWTPGIQRYILCSSDQA